MEVLILRIMMAGFNSNRPSNRNGKELCYERYFRETCQGGGDCRMVDAACGRNISGNSVEGLFVNHECPAGMDARSMGTRHQLVVRPEYMVLDRVGIQDVHLAAGAGSHLADAVGAAVEERNIMNKSSY